MSGIPSFGDAEDGREIKLLGFRLHPLTGEEVVAEIRAAVTEQRRLIMTNANLHALAVMYQSPAMAKLLSQPDSRVMIDSMPVLFLANLLGHRLPRAKRTTSLDFYDAMFRVGTELGWSFGYVGADPETLEAGLSVLRQQIPGLRIEGRNGYFPVGTDQPVGTEREIIDWLVERSHDVVIVGMGMPRQEEWIERIQHWVPSRVFLTAGAYIDYKGGTQQPPPRWLGQIGLEWSHRLLHSPRRLSYRYLIEPLVLIWRLIVSRHPQKR